jgi:hypothetical protein
MSDNRPLTKKLETANYNSLAAAINYSYCKKHGYEFRYYQPYLTNRQEVVLHNCLDPNSNLPRHASWSKLLSTQKLLSEGLHLKNYDYVVYIDSDCIFKDFEKPLESVIDKKHDILISNNEPSSAGPCAGFYICKVNEPTLQFVTDWYNTDIPHRNINRLWEQSALTKIYKKYDVGLLDNEDFFHERPGQFLRHINSFSNNTRIPYFTRFLAEKGIDYADAIQKISFHAFRTTTRNHAAKRFSAELSSVKRFSAELSSVKRSSVKRSSAEHAKTVKPTRTAKNTLNKTKKRSTKRSGTPLG